MTAYTQYLAITLALLVFFVLLRTITRLTRGSTPEERRRAKRILQSRLQSWDGRTVTVDEPDELPPSRVKRLAEGDEGTDDDGAVRETARLVGFIHSALVPEFATEVDEGEIAFADEPRKRFKSSADNYVVPAPKLKAVWREWDDD